MNISFYTAVTGASEQQRRIDITANNIANVNTHGFKAQQTAFSELLHGSIRTTEGNNIQRGTGSRIVMTQTDFRSGSLAPTGRILDYMIEGNGFFAVEDGATGEIYYTRDGSFTLAQMTGVINDEGEEGSVFYLSDGDGRFILDQEGERILVEDPNELLPVGVFDFINTNGMLHVGGGRFTPVDKNGEVLEGSGRAIQGVLEASNADLAHEIVKVIEAQRSFTYALKMIQTSDEIETTVNNLRA